MDESMRSRDGSEGGAKEAKGRSKTGRRGGGWRDEKKGLKMPNSSEVLGDKIRFFTKKSHVLLHI